MADQKISQLTSATTPLAGTEVLPIVQSGATVKVSVENVVKAIQPGSTANTIPYLNASKTPTNGTALQFNGKVIGTSITPSAWASNYTGWQGQEGYAALVSDNGNGVAELVSNSYNDGSWKYVNSSIGSVRMQGNAVSKTFALYTAPAGTAGGAISWTQRFSVSDTGVTVNADNLTIDTSGKGFVLPGGISWTSGVGSPEGVVTAPVGSLYSRSDGGLLTSLYVKQSGSGNTGWAGK